MALIGPTFAIAAVGISCQPAHQIEEHRIEIAEHARQPLERHATPFDGLLVSIADAAAMIREDCFYPTDFDGPLIDAKPYWPRFHAHFWHAKTVNPADFVSKHAHLRANWDRLRLRKRTIFVVANTQNNVGRVLADRDSIETRLFWDDVLGLYEALAPRFPGCELRVVTRDGLDDGVRASALLIKDTRGRAPIVIHRIGRDGSQWAGNGHAWAQVFVDIILNHVSRG